MSSALTRSLLPIAGGVLISVALLGDAVAQERPYARRGVKDPYPPDPYVYRAPAPTPIWTGVYLGVHGGGGWAGVEPTGNFDEHVGMRGWAAGLHAGYNWQWHRTVIGIEGDFSWTDKDGVLTLPASVVDARADWLGSLRLRAGFTVSNLLFFATAGVAMGSYDIGVTTPLVSSRVSKTMTGYVVGAGVEAKFSRNISARLETLYYGFGEQDFRFATGTVPVDADALVVRAGITFHLN